MMIFLLILNALSVIAYFGQRWLPQDGWVAIAGAIGFAASILGMLVYLQFFRPKTSNS